MSNNTLKTLSIVTLFAIAMAFLESVIVYYIRIIYYPGGFSFPLVGFMDPEVLNVEIIREIFTLVMLASVALLASKSAYKRFAYFLYVFAVWDIFYYVWLKVILNWPSSFLAWDILFLIPWSWAGPVLAPLISSFTMIIISFSIFYISHKGYDVNMNKGEWILLFIGGFLQLYTFLYDYGKLIFENRLNEISSYVPYSFNWSIFIAGEMFILYSILHWHFRALKNKKIKQSQY